MPSSHFLNDDTTHQRSCLLHKNPIHPAWVMLMFWGLMIGVYYLGPITLTPALSWKGALFQATHIALFLLGTWGASIACSKTHRFTPSRVLNETASQTYAPYIALMLLIGLTGNLLSICHHWIVLQSLDLSSAASYRAMKAQHLLHGKAMQSGCLSILAFFMYPAGFVGLVAGWLNYEQLPRTTRALLFGFIIALFGAAILAGGRSPILLLIFFIAISSYVRTTRGQPLIPSSRALRATALLLIASFVVYSSILWSVRAEESKRNTEQNLQYAIDVWGAKPKPYLLAISQTLHQPSLTMSILGPVFYLTQHFSVTEKILAHPEKIPVLYGGYHIDLVAAALRHTPTGARMLQKNYAKLLQASIYGYFTGVWGALFIDYRYASLLIALLWGFASGWAWIRFQCDRTIKAAVFYVFWINSILIGFASPPFGFSNSLLVFAWFCVFMVCSKSNKQA